MLLKVSQEAEQIIHDFTIEVNKKLSELGFVLEYSFRKEFLFNVENACRLFSMMSARKRGSMIVGAIDAEKSIKHASPEMLIKHALGTPEEYRLCRKIREENFRILKQHVESLDKPRLLDAGCGWGRQITSYRRRGLTAEFFGVDINKIAVHYGKTVNPDVHFIVADVQNLPFRDRCFNVVICLNVVSQIRQSKGTENSIREFSRVLDSRGLLELEDAFTKNMLMTKTLNIVARILRLLLPEVGHLCHLNHVNTLLKENEFIKSQVIKLRPTITPFLFGNIYSILAYKK